MYEELLQKRVLITGSGSGIGACTARLFGSYGAIVGVHFNTSRSDAESIAAGIVSGGGKAILLSADLIDFSNQVNLVREFIVQAGGIDILINNAAAVHGHDHFLLMKPSDWDNTLQVCLSAPFFIAKESFAYMKEHCGGRIINISSIASKYGGSPYTAHYGAAKAGLDAITHTLAKEGAQYNILVNSIQPSVIDTGFHKKIGRDSLQERVKKIPLQHAGNPLDVANMCLFLSSDAGCYITNQIIGVTGGD